MALKIVIPGLEINLTNLDIPLQSTEEPPSPEPENLPNVVYKLKHLLCRAMVAHLGGPDKHAKKEAVHVSMNDIGSEQLLDALGANEAPGPIFKPSG